MVNEVIPELSLVPGFDARLEYLAVLVVTDCHQIDEDVQNDLVVEVLLNHLFDVALAKLEEDVLIQICCLHVATLHHLLNLLSENDYFRH